jgi:MOSC domain-containing protein YiiM
MGRVHQINVSEGGVPKLPVEHAVVDESGVVGDTQADRIHHGHSHQALCLFSLEVIESLQAEGHPIESGNVGENVTVSGLDWNRVVPGVTLRIGEATVEVTNFAGPCVKNAGWFKDRFFNRIDVERFPGESRVYARVLAGGSISRGDRVELLDE